MTRGELPHDSQHQRGEIPAHRLAQRRKIEQEAVPQDATDDVDEQLKIDVRVDLAAVLRPEQDFPERRSAPEQEPITERLATGTTALAAVNGAIERIVSPLAAELAPVRVNAVAPGVVDTPWWSFLPEEQKRSNSRRPREASR